MVTFPPLAPSAKWFARYIKALPESPDEATAIQRANSEIESPKEFGRFNLIDKNGHLMVNSVAVEGGGRQLRNYDKLPDLRLSNHGDWRKIHLGSIEAILGRMPFYRDIELELKRIYGDTHLSTLALFNSAIFRVINTFLMENIAKDSLSDFRNDPVIKERGAEIARLINHEESILRAVALFGKETLLGIMAI